MQILPASSQSLFLQMDLMGHKLSSGTGFVVKSLKGPVLITNRHNVTGLHNDTGVPLSPNGNRPNEITISHHKYRSAGQWVLKTEPLYNEGVPLWVEHPNLGAKADFVALPLTSLSDVDIYPCSIGVGDPPILTLPSDTVSVVGFPFGIGSGGGLPIWATGFMATEPDIDHDNLPMFLIDCRARPGQSGSAVIAQRNGGLVPLDGGANVAYNAPITRFLGIYSGRINEQSDLGRVWKAKAIKELVDSIK